MSSTLQFILNPPLANVQSHLSYPNGHLTIDDAGNVDGDWDERQSNKDGHTGYQKVDPGPFELLVRAPGYKDAWVTDVMPHDETITINLERVYGESVSRLRAERFGFVNGAGQRVFLAGVSAFMHYESYLNGVDIRSLLEQARTLGANCIRVFGMAHYIPVNAGRPAFKPATYGDRYFDEIPNFCEWASRYGLYVYWSVFPDADLIQPGDKRAFLNRVVECLKQSSNTIGELTNEQDAHSFNAVDPTTVDRPSGIAFCSGSYGDIGTIQPHPWDFCDYHQPRRYDPPTHIKDACVVDHPNYLAGKGILLGEPDRYGTGGNPNHDQARQSAGACRETALGMVFHTMQGRESLTYDDATMAQGRVFFNALIGAANV